MSNNKLFATLRYFSKYEQNRCRKFLLSPYFNKNETLMQLFELLVKKINSNGSAELDKERIWKKLHPDGTPYDDVRLRKYFSDLLKLVEAFLAQEVYQSNPLYQATYFMEAVEQKKIERLYRTAKNTADRLSNRQANKSSQFFFYQYQIERNYYQIQQFDRRPTEQSNIEAIARNLDVFYLAEKLRYYCTVLSHKYQYTHDYEIYFIKEIIEHVEKHDYDDVPPVAIYFQIYKALVDSENLDHYYRLKDLLKTYGSDFPRDEASYMFIFALNYCTRKVNKGHQEFLSEYFDLYQELLNKRIIFEKEELPPGHFKNMITIGLRLGEIEWIENFINQYQIYLPDAQRENAVTFNKAQLYFYKKDYGKVIELISHVEYEDFTYNLNSKTFLLASYYEMDEIEALYSLMDSFRAFLNRHKDIPARRRSSYINLIRLVRKLTRIMPGDEKAIEKLKEEINTHQNSIGSGNTRWLMEKVEELV